MPTFSQASSNSGCHEWLRRRSSRKRGALKAVAREDAGDHEPVDRGDGADLKSLRSRLNGLSVVGQGHVGHLDEPAGPFSLATYFQRFAQPLN